MKKGIKIWAFIVYVVFAAVYLGGNEILRHQGMEYRNWVTVLGFVIFACLTVILIAGLCISGGYIAKKKKGLSRVPKRWICIGIIMTIIGCIIMIAIGMTGYEKLGRETKKDDMIMVTHSTVMGDYHAFWKPVGPLLRRTVRSYDQEVYGALEQKYNMGFRPVDSDKGIASYISEEYPYITVTVYNLNPVEDDFCEQYSALQLEKAWKNPDTEYTDDFMEVDFGKVNDEWQFSLLLKDKSAEEEFYRLGAHLISLAQKDGFFDKFPGTLYMQALNTDESVAGINVKFGQGKDYTERELYNIIKADMDSAFYQAENIEKIQDCAVRIYEEYFMDNPGDTYAEGRDEKNRFFADISNKYRLVFDRESVNGKCLLFALYSIDENQLKEYYAVDKETGKITPGGKCSDADPGSEEYYKAAGEY